MLNEPKTWSPEVLGGILGRLAANDPDALRAIDI
jgi:hypothetical protein